MNEITDLALLAQGGDRMALASFVSSTQAEVWRLCSYLAGRDEADDLTQETYLRALPALARFRGDANARTWLLAIARRAAADHIRSLQRQRRFRRTLRVAVTEPDPNQLTDVDLVLVGLEPERRAAFVLTQVLGLTYAEAAAVCDVPVGTIRSRVARARTQLIGALGADGT